MALITIDQGVFCDTGLVCVFYTHDRICETRESNQRRCRGDLFGIGCCKARSAGLFPTISTRVGDLKFAR